MENAATLYHKSKTNLNINSSLLFINLFLKSTDLLKQNSSKSLRDLFFHTLTIFLFVSNLNRSSWDCCCLCYSIYKLHTKKPYCSVFFNILSNHVVLQENYSSEIQGNDNANISKATFR